MKRRLQTRHVLVITVLIGVMISASYYVVKPLDLTGSYEQSVHPLLRPVYYLSLLNIVPRMIVAVLLRETLGLPAALGEEAGALYWPAMGAFVGVWRHWALLGLGVLLAHAGLFALLIYALSKMKLTF